MQVHRWDSTGCRRRQKGVYPDEPHKVRSGRAPRACVSTARVQERKNGPRRNPRRRKQGTGYCFVLVVDSGLMAAGALFSFIDGTSSCRRFGRGNRPWTYSVQMSVCRCVRACVRVARGWSRLGGPAGDGEGCQSSWRTGSQQTEHLLRTRALAN